MKNGNFTKDFEADHMRYQLKCIGRVCLENSINFKASNMEFTYLIKIVMERSIISFLDQKIAIEEFQWKIFQRLDLQN